MGEGFCFLGGEGKKAVMPFCFLGDDQFPAYSEARAIVDVCETMVYYVGTGKSGEGRRGGPGGAKNERERRRRSNGPSR